MGILKMLTADLQDLNVADVTTTYTTISSTYARTGTYSFKMKYSNDYIQANIPDSKELYLKAAATRSQVGAVNLYPFNLYEGSTNHAALRINTTNKTFGVYRYTTLLEEVALPDVDFNLGYWNVYEGHYICDDTDGIWEIKVNGELVIAYSGDTRNGGTNGLISFVRFNNLSNGDMFYDDLVVRDDQWPGQGGIYVLVPDSGSTTEDWTASAGNPEDCVDEIPASFTDYIGASAAVSGVQHLVGIESLPITPQTIGGVGVVSLAQLSETGSGGVRNILKSNTTTDKGDITNLSGTGGTYIEVYYDQNPDDAADWEEADINALEIGVETK